MNERTARLERCLTALGCSGMADLPTPAQGLEYELALANIVLAISEVHILGIEATAAVGPGTAELLADQIAHRSLPEGLPEVVLLLRARRLSHALHRAAGGTAERPDDPVLATARDAVLLARLLIGYRLATEEREPDLPADLLGAVPDTLRSITARLDGLAG